MELHPGLELVFEFGHHLLVPRPLEIQETFGCLGKVVPGGLVPGGIQCQLGAVNVNPGLEKITLKFL